MHESVFYHVDVTGFNVSQHLTDGQSNRLTIQFLTDYQLDQATVLDRAPRVIKMLLNKRYIKRNETAIRYKLTCTAAVLSSKFTVASVARCATLF
jgi:hypothetical protein